MPMFELKSAIGHVMSEVLTTVFVFLVINQLNAKVLVL